MNGRRLSRAVIAMGVMVACAGTAVAGDPPNAAPRTMAPGAADTPNGTDPVAPPVASRFTYVPPPEPILTLRATAGRPDTGFNVGLTAFHPILFEFGAGYGEAWKCYYARGGIGILVHDGRNARGRGLRIDGAGLLGYRSCVTEVLPANAVSLTAGIEGVFWMLPHLGLSLQLQGGVNVGPAVTNAIVPDLRAAVGIAF